MKDTEALGSKSHREFGNKPIPDPTPTDHGEHGASMAPELEPNLLKEIEDMDVSHEAAVGPGELLEVEEAIPVEDSPPIAADDVAQPSVGPVAGPKPAPRPRVQKKKTAAASTQAVTDEWDQPGAFFSSRVSTRYCTSATRPRGSHKHGTPHAEPNITCQESCSRGGMQCSNRPRCSSVIMKAL